MAARSRERDEEAGVDGVLWLLSCSAALFRGLLEGRGKILKCAAGRAKVSRELVFVRFGTVAWDDFLFGKAMGGCTYTHTVRVTLDVSL